MIKASLGKLTVPDDFMHASDQFDELPVSLAHAETIQGLPSHHRDPFGRLLSA